MEGDQLSDARKEQKKNNQRKQEANFLRFLRTTERTQNYQTLKIIGKGAFGEVKLVQRKQDGKIYALKSLIKSEMVRSLVLPGFAVNCVPSLTALVLTMSVAQKGPACSRASRARHPGQR